MLVQKLPNYIPIHIVIYAHTGGSQGEGLRRTVAGWYPMMESNHLLLLVREVYSRYTNRIFKMVHQEGLEPVTSHALKVHCFIY